MDITREAVAEFQTGSGTVGTTAARIHSGKGLVKGVVVRAGTKPIAIQSTPGATSNAGFQLGAGEQSPWIHIDDLSKVWVIGSEAGCDYSWLAI
jgi:hypothetical protein